LIGSADVGYQRPSRRVDDGCVIDRHSGRRPGVEANRELFTTRWDSTVERPANEIEAVSRHRNRRL
jgi:hypothetical protein